MSDDQNIEYAIWDRAQRRHADRAEQKRRAERYDDLLLGVAVSIALLDGFLSGTFNINDMRNHLPHLAFSLKPEDREALAIRSVQSQGFSTEQAEILKRELCRVLNNHN